MGTVELAYDDTGTGPVLVLLHAFPCRGALWDAQRSALAAVGWRVVTPDLRGFGRSPLGDDPPNLGAMAEDVTALLRRLDVDRYVLGGLSMGGYVAMELLRRDPDPVAGLILADTKAGADAQAARDNRERIASSVLAEGTSVLYDSVLPGLLGATTFASRPDVVTRVRGWIEAADPAAIAWAQRAMAERPESLSTLAGFASPAMVVRGSQDALSSADDVAAMLEALPRGSGVEIPDSGHLTAVEDPAALTAAIMEFVEPLRPPFC